MPAFRHLSAAVLAATAALPLYARQPSAPLPPAHDLVRDVMYNELHDRERDSHWEYRSDNRSPAEDIVREQVETSQGPVFRIIERNGSALNPDQSRREDQRLNQYIHDPSEVQRVRREHEEDEARLEDMMRMLPGAFLFDYEPSPDHDIARVAFRPDPAFVPSGYEARIAHGMTGTLTIDLRLKRLIDIHGSLAQRVDLGFGLLGHIERGSWFEIHREQVSATHWKADLVEVHIDGKVLMFRTISKDQREVRSDFHPVPGAATLEEARNWLEQMPAQPNRAMQAQLAPGK